MERKNGTIKQQLAKATKATRKNLVCVQSLWDWLQTHLRIQQLCWYTVYTFIFPVFSHVMPDSDNKGDLHEYLHQEVRAKNFWITQLKSSKLENWCSWRRSREPSGQNLDGWALTKSFRPRQHLLQCGMQRDFLGFMWASTNSWDILMLNTLVT